MDLPWLGVQTAYATLAWAIVLAAAMLAVWAWRRRVRPAIAMVVMVMSVLACALPGSASPDYWLMLAFNLPSPLLVFLCAMTLPANARNLDGHRVMPTGLAAGLALTGALLYSDSVGWIHLGLYVRGFGGEAAFAGLVVGAAAVLAIATGLARGTAFAVLGALALFALWRLPSGNVWDALLDPLLWLWSVFSLVARARERRRGLVRVNQVAEIAT